MAEGTAKTIDQLPSKTTLLDTDYLPVDDGAQSYKTTLLDLAKKAGGVVSFGNSGNVINVTMKDGTVFTLTITDSSKQDVLTFDTEPTVNSENPVTSGGVYNTTHAIEEDVAANTTAIGNEATRAAAAEQANANAISAEVTRATGVEGALEDAIEAEETRATAAEDAIEAALAALGLEVVDGLLCAVYEE